MIGTTPIWLSHLVHNLQGEVNVSKLNKSQHEIWLFLGEKSLILNGHQNQGEFIVAHALLFLSFFLYLFIFCRLHLFFKLSDQGPFCGVTSTLRFGLRMTLPMSFKVRMESSPVLFCRLCETIPRASLVAGTGYETRGAFHK